MIFTVGYFYPLNVTTYCEKQVTMTITQYHITTPNDVYTETIQADVLDLDQTYVQGFRRVAWSNVGLSTRATVGGTSV
jgi:hypothetical protein